MEVERTRERDEREKQLKEISELKDVVLNALQDPEKRATIQRKVASGFGGLQLAQIFGDKGAPDGTVGGYEDDFDDNASLQSGSSVNSSVLAGSVSSAAESLYANPHRSQDELALQGVEMRSGSVFGVDLGKSKLRGRQEGFEWLSATVMSYKHPYFTVKYDNGETEELTLNEVQQMMASDDQAEGNAGVHDDDGSSEAYTSE